MTKIKEKLLVASQDEDALKVLEQFGLTKDFIEGYNELEKPATLDEALKSFNLQSDFDKRVDKALKTREDNLKAKYDFVEKEQKEDTKEPEVKDPAMKALLEEISEMKKWRQEQEEQKKVQTIEQKKSQAAEFLKSHNIPSIYGSKFDLEKPLEEQLDTVKGEYEKDFGTVAKQPGIKMPVPRRVDDNKPSKSEVEEFKRKMR